MLWCPVPGHWPVWCQAQAAGAVSARTPTSQHLLNTRCVYWILCTLLGDSRYIEVIPLQKKTCDIALTLCAKQEIIVLAFF